MRCVNCHRTDSRGAAKCHNTFKPSVDTYFHPGARTPRYIFLNAMKRWVHFLLEILPKRLLLLKAWNYNQLLPPTDPIFTQILSPKHRWERILWTGLH